MMESVDLTYFLNDMAVIRTVFEMLDLFPSDDPIEREMREMIEESRQNLIRGIQAVCDVISTNPARLPFPLREFQREMIRDIAKGWDRNRLDNFMKINAFDDGEESLYYFEAAQVFDRELAEKMSAQEFALLIFNQMLYHICKPENYSNRKVFEQTIFQRFLFVLFVSQCVKLYPFWQP